MNIGLVNVVSQKDENNTEKDLSEKQKMILDNLYRCRDLEINNLWQKSTFLAPFLILCFTGYGFLLYELVKEDGFKYQGLLKYENLVKYEQVINVDTSITKINILCIALCAVSALFSILWILMFKGSKAQFELCERTIANYEQKELEIPYGYAMGTLRHNEIEFDDGLLNTKAGKFSPSKVNIVIGQVSLWIWIICFVIHMLIDLDILHSLEKGYSFVFGIITFIVIGLLLCYNKGIKSSYLSEDNEKKYVESFNSLEGIDTKEVKNDDNLCFFSILCKLFKSLFAKKNRTNKKILNKNQIILEELREYYKISKERAEQLEKYSSIPFFPNWKEEKYIKMCKRIIKKEGDIEKQKKNLDFFSSELGISEEHVRILNEYIKNKCKK